MILNKNFFRIIFVLFLILLTQVFSELVLVKNDIYYILPFIDIPMHIFGGFLFGILFIFIFEYLNILYTSRKSENINLKEKVMGKVLKENLKLEKYLSISFTRIIILVLCIGIMWEIYEYLSDIVSYRDWGGILDTIKDIMDDLIGAGLAYLTFGNKK